MDDSAVDSASKPQPDHEDLIAHLQRLASAAAEPALQALLADFVRHYFEHTPAELLRLRSPQEMAGLAYRHFLLGLQRAPGEIKVFVQPPPDAANPSALASIQTCLPDMPFLLDTVAMAVREAGAIIDLTLHPVLHLRRAADGRLQQIASAAGGDSESWIHMEFEPLADPQSYGALEQAARAALGDLQLAVLDSDAMRRQALELAAQLQPNVPGLDAEDAAEAQAFLRWLVEGHFTFLGVAMTAAEPGPRGRPHFVLQPERALGLCKPGQRYADADALIAPKAELDKYIESPRLVVLTKALLHSSVYLPEFLEVISVKRIDERGNVRGTCRFIGLFAADVYMDRPQTIPLIRRKAEHVLQRSRAGENSYDGKLLREILHTLPRDELFQSNEEELFQTVMGIRALLERQRLRVFLRRDRYGRFYSCMLYLPRDRYSRELRDRVSAELQRLFNALSIDRHVDFLRGGYARVRYIVRTPPGTQLPLSASEVEQRLIAVTRSWREQLRELLSRTSGAEGAAIAARFGDALPLSYTEGVSPEEAASDLHFLSRLSADEAFLPRLMLSDGDAPPRITGLNLYSYGKPVALSDVLPTLENFGLRVIWQEPTEVKPRSGPPLWIQEFEIEAALGGLPAQGQKARFETALLRAWKRETEDDRLNRLVLAAGLDCRQISCLRMLGKYINQIGLPYGRAEIERLLAEHPAVARGLVRLFETRFSPALDDTQRKMEGIRYAQELDQRLDEVTSLDADRVLRTFLSVVRAGLRTNFYQRLPDGRVKPCISLKLDPSKVTELPLPRPMFEVWVYAPEVEGIHLRGGRVARGGLRWSDRREDFRTEVLGLMKAQMVKNAVIVPVGAKGGFVVKNPVDPVHREASQKQGIECYKTFVRGLLDITDNRVGDQIVPPRDVVRHDDDDPYLVVAADKGTASFSDIANGLAADYGFWLGDAFASGGSAGYDHKKMGITAKGAWESVKRHFRELEWTDGQGALRQGRDIQSEPFTVVGIGDMSGDVFGNGMMLSRQTRLLAAFDHRHVFIDPAPDAEASFNERVRLYGLARSSWADYDAALISKGGGVYPRTAKAIKLSDEACAALGIATAVLTPPELIRAILKAPVDLLWNGGIGTYVKAQHQSHEEVRDRANDAVRINGRDLRCKVVGEGGNLGFTQLGRIEYALDGGRINTDAIDNSGGVHCSDREVNIKIPLNKLMAEGRLSREQRDPLLVACTDDVARFVLRDNYVQSGCISLQSQDALLHLDEHTAQMRRLERDGLLSRALEFLPDEDTLTERRSQQRGLTRPELAVLVAYSKISLFDAALSSDTPDDAFFRRDLLGNFPEPLIERYRDEFVAHRLRREIVATLLSNAVVNRMGLAFAHRLAEHHGCSRGAVLSAYAAAHEIFDGDAYWADIECLDNRVPAATQYRLMRRPVGLLKHVTGWLIGSQQVERKSLSLLVERYAGPVRELTGLLPGSLPPSFREAWTRAVSGMTAEAVPLPIAERLATTMMLGSALDITDLAHEARVSLTEAAVAYFRVGERFSMLWLLAATLALPAHGPWQSLARSNLREDAYRLQRLLTAQVLGQPADNAEARFAAWAALNESKVQSVTSRLQEIHVAGAPDFASLGVALRELQKLLAR